VLLLPGADDPCTTGPGQGPYLGGRTGRAALHADATAASRQAAPHGMGGRVRGLTVPLLLGDRRKASCSISRRWKSRTSRRRQCGPPLAEARQADGAALLAPVAAAGKALIAQARRLVADHGDVSTPPSTSRFSACASA
jgi:hypothetical protein